ncbi:MAG TPA: glucoamylase family protein [Anaerolineales bacterium]|nr:glucoamylase family protein [Anaerolineales bacterium]
MESSASTAHQAKEGSELLDELQRDSFKYFLDKTNRENGLVLDSTWEDSPSSIAAVGFGLAVLPVGVERGWISRQEAIERTLVTLRFFANSHQGPEPDATGYQGFYYHFLDPRSGQRVRDCELSTIDTTVLISGALFASQYFDRDLPGEREIRQVTDQLYHRLNWNWAQDGELTIRHGWLPESGFLEHRWQGYDEALLLYLLALGSPQHTLPDESYKAYTSTYRWETYYGYELLHAAPLFIHQFSHVWIDFRGIQDEPMRARDIDYFENSRRAAHVHRQHTIQNPHQFRGYGGFAWGITASEGPIRGTTPLDVDGRTFYGYLARGVPEPDDGTLSPWTAITALPFVPEIALPTIGHYVEVFPQLAGEYGLKCSLNPSFPGEAGSNPGWFSDHYYGINEGPIVLMIENYLSGLPWRLMKGCRPVVAGLRKAGFRGGWLNHE